MNDVAVRFPQVDKLERHKKEVTYDKTSQGVHSISLHPCDNVFLKSTFLVS